MWYSFVVTLLGAVVTYGFSTRQSITPLSSSQISAFNPYSYYATVAYCTPAQTLAWNCGANCKANPSFKTVASGGTGNSVQYWYVGYDPTLKTVIVAHEGTDLSEILSIVTDIKLIRGPLDKTLFPGLPSGIEVHTGFRDEQAKTATSILSAVQSTMSKYGSTSVTLVGHSLGAALSLLDSVYLPLHLPNSTSFKTIGYGLPRVGNQAFANYVDKKLNLTHINNKEDVVPIVPPESLGFVHPAGEIHIEDSGVWAVCPGQDNPSPQCAAGDVDNILDGSVNDHYGPYNGILIGSC